MYYIYILRCEDGSLYTGITTDISRRLEEHSGSGGRGAKFTRSHKVEAVEALWSTSGRSNASKLEWRIKQLTRQQKLALIADNSLLAGFIGAEAAEIYKREKYEDHINNHI
ncbi:MAG: GIY-YIG nuclease family protein [Ruminococcus sp.]|nr:GIY-YIG nuclease family protein [Ruminococcus sp.]HRR77543.1 GIY-YIG nuclease family protein [Ruminococcus sp.]